MLVLIDYGLGNVGSVDNMLRKLGWNCVAGSSPQQIEAATKLILPGVGAFDEGMALLERRGLVQPILKAVNERHVPILGICLGMQMLTQRSEEGSLPGLGLVDAITKRFRPTVADPHLRVPHMGWNYVNVARPSRITDHLDDSSRFYFVHSYYVECHRAEDIVVTAKYGQDFAAGFERDNIVGVQFHPEKSHKFGLRLLRNFVELY